MQLSWSLPIVVVPNDADDLASAMRERAETHAERYAEELPTTLAMRARHKVRKFGRTPRYGRDRGAAQVGVIAAVAVAVASLLGGAAIGRASERTVDHTASAPHWAAEVDQARAAMPGCHVWAQRHHGTTLVVVDCPVPAT